MFSVTHSHSPAPIIRASDASHASEAATGATNEPKSKADYYAIWDAWEKDASPGEQRDVAVARLKYCLDREACHLNLNALGLQKLPDYMPPSCERLLICFNELTELPAKLPYRLTELHANNNLLEYLPNTLPDSLECIEVGFCKFRALPAKLPQLKVLIAYNNRLERLPDNLPDSIEELDVSHNALEALPVQMPGASRRLHVSWNQIPRLHAIPPHVTGLWLGNNLLTDLPDLPRGLEYLHVEHNQLPHLSDNFPTGMKSLNAKNNQLTGVPESVARLSPQCRVALEGNPLSPRTRGTLQDIAADPNYQGPRISFSMSTGGASGSDRALHEMVMTWLPPVRRADIIRVWSAIAKEDNATAFAGFLSRLEDTESVKKFPEFTQQVAAWLIRLSDAPSLRQQIFLIAQGATETCEDRVALTYNEMQKAVVVHDVDDGKYDVHLPGVISVGREMFRLEQLENIARGKVEKLKFVDEVEVYLAYQVKLRKPLQLASAIQDMRFFGAAGVTEDDLAHAEILVKTREDQDFPRWLSQWLPWQSAVQRIAPSHHEAAIKKRDDVLTASYPARVAAELKALGLEHDLDATSAIGKKVFAQMTTEIDVTLTHAVLAERHALALLNKVWNI